MSALRPFLSTLHSVGNARVQSELRALGFRGTRAAMAEDIQQRKADHIAVAASGNADFRRKGTLLPCVQLIHQSLPELRVEELDLHTDFFGQTLRAPLMISGMTGGTAEAKAINRDLAKVAENMGIAFGLGSQRAMAEHPELLETYAVRDACPDLVLVGNIGVVQAAQYGATKISQLAESVGASAMALHLNPAQELMQAHGDRNFRGAVATIKVLRESLSIPVVVKETGCGLSRQAIQQIRGTGVEWVDVAGAGGTSWVAVEKHRAEDKSREEFLAEEFWDWGIPTAASVAWAAEADMHCIASGGMRTGLDAARALALGARVVGMAAPVLRAWQKGGQSGAQAYLEQVLESLKSAMLLTGSKTPRALSKAAKLVASPLKDWIHGG